MLTAVLGVLGLLKDPVTKASEKWFETAKDKAEATSLYLKAIDPNGKMRREITKTTMRLYSTYVYVMLVLLLSQSFDVGNAKQIATAVTNMKDLFLPITTAFGTIMTASFGVNGVNSYKGN